MIESGTSIPNESLVVDDGNEGNATLVAAESCASQEQEGSMEPTRRISAELRGDNAVEADMLETILRIHEIGRTKVERDSMLVQLAIMSLGRVVTEYRQKTGKRFPTAQDIEAYLHE